MLNFQTKTTNCQFGDMHSDRLKNFSLVPRRTVFQHAGPESFHDKVTQQAETLNRKNLNAETAIQEDADANIQALAQAALDKGQTTSAEEIKANIQNQLKPGIDLKNFWINLRRAGAEKCGFKKGDFVVTKGTNEIDIKPFLKPFTKELSSDPVSIILKEERPKAFAAATEARKAFLDETLKSLKGKLPPVSRPSTLQ